MLPSTCSRLYGTPTLALILAFDHPHTNHSDKIISSLQAQKDLQTTSYGRRLVRQAHT
ncbi:unnamed protein product [Periconia digitata]|uniref:Uncharacterized protein n=1 Tax=Periconia digitata TaxID=1303443 RepID=A0A9W4XZE7_9PLEO|nr:unnamed protein product [Periconia digitata]